MFKNKKYIFGIVITLLLLLVFVLFMFYFINKRNEENGVFSLETYVNQIETYDESIQKGRVESRKEAKKVAKEVFSESEFDYVSDYFDFEIYYDDTNGCYLAKGKYKKWSLKVDLGNYNGGTPYLIVDKNGKILAMWMDGK